MNPKLPDRDSTNVGAGIDTFVSHRWDKSSNSSKRIKTVRNVTNANSLGNIYAASDKALGGNQQPAAAD